jgi:hypothetical protein
MIIIASKESGLFTCLSKLKTSIPSGKNFVEEVESPAKDGNKCTAVIGRHRLSLIAGLCYDKKLPANISPNQFRGSCTAWPLKIGLEGL